MSETGRAVQSARMQAGLSQRQAAALALLPISYYRKVERGEIEPRLCRLAEIYRALTQQSPRDGG